MEVTAGEGKASVAVYEDFTLIAELPKEKLDMSVVGIDLLLSNIAALGLEGEEEFFTELKTGLEGVVEPTDYLKHIYKFGSAAAAVTVDFENSFVFKLAGDGHGVITGKPDSQSGAESAWKAFAEHLSLTSGNGEANCILIANGSYIKVGTEYLHFDSEFNGDLKIDGTEDADSLLKTIREALILETKYENQGHNATVFLKKGTEVSFGSSALTLNDDYLIEITFGESVGNLLCASLLEGFKLCEDGREMIIRTVMLADEFAGALQEDGKINVSMHPVDIASYSVALNLADDIAINFYVKNIDPRCNLNGFSVSYTYGGVETEGSVSSYSSNQFTVAKCAAKEMGDTVRIKVYYDDALIKDLDYSVRQYCESQLANPDLPTKDRKLCLAVLDYGAYSQRAFGYNYDYPVNANYSTGLVISTVVPDDFKGESDGKCTGIEKTKVSLGLEYQTELMFYFVPADGYTMDDFVFSKNGAKILPEEMDNGTYRIKITGIAAKNLGEPVKVSVTNKTDSSCKTISFSPMSWAYSQQGSSDKSTSLLARALYLYYDASVGYFSAN
ncbi:MAG: hypothetical protein J5933_02750 [Clostridia bacterium]|nr:hypothetical protein [Clostridia bacterium]